MNISLLVTKKNLNFVFIAMKCSVSNTLTEINKGKTVIDYLLQVKKNTIFF